MKELIELLNQIQDLAGVGIDALQQASGGDAATAAAGEAMPPAGEGAPQKGAPAGPPAGEGAPQKGAPAGPPR